MLAWLLMLTSCFVVDAAGVSPADSAQQFTYDATEAKGRRATARVYSGSEDAILDSAKRQKLNANARDIRRNFAIASWMIRKHLDYVASFEYHCRSGDTGLDTDVEFLMSEWGKKQNFDIRRRHRRSKFLRIAEGMRCVDGDFGFLKLASGQVQGIESDRIKNPDGQSGQWTHGVRMDGAGAANAYSIHKRTGTNSLTFERVIPADNFILHGHFDRYDQVRGISPLASALNPLRDVYESFDYALAKAKVSQLFAFAMYREAYDAAGEVSNDGEEGTERNAFSTDFGRGPVFLDLGSQDKAEFLESSQPSTQFQEFTQLVIMVALKALDIPYSFYDEKHTNFFGSRGAWLHYERACKDKREDLLEVLYELTDWRQSLWLLDNTLKLPSGKSLRDLNGEWVPTGMPWWDPAKEIRGDMMAIGAALDNPQRIVKERGRGDWYDNVDRIAEAIAYAKEKGVPLSFAIGPDPQEVEVVGDA